jgi:activating signal cointegrator 1
MKALSLTQPWATLIAIGLKTIETRSWSTKYRGTIGIHASKGFPSWAREFVTDGIAGTDLRQFSIGVEDLPLGSIIATAEITGCYSTNQENLLIKSPDTLSIPLPGTRENLYGDYSANRFMWKLESVKPLREPIACKGALSLWDVPVEIERQIKEQTL